MNTWKRLKKRTMEPVVPFGCSASFLPAVCICILLLGSLGIGGCRFGGTEVVLTASLTNEQVFRIQDQVCALSEAKVFLTNYQNIYATVYNLNLWEHEFGEYGLEDYVKDLTISQLAQIISMGYLADQQGISLAEEELTQIKKAAKEYYASLSKDEIRYMNINQGTIENMYQQYGLANKLYSHLTGGVNVEVSDDEARVMQALQLYVTNEDTANEVKVKLENGGDFLALANTYNEAGETEITFGRGKMPAEVEEAAFTMETGEVSDAIPAGKGFYFLKCMDNYNQDLTDANKKVIVEKRRKEAFDDVYEEFIRTLPSEINEDLWKGVRVKVNEKITTSSFFKTYEEYCKW